MALVLNTWLYDLFIFICVDLKNELAVYETSQSDKKQDKENLKEYDSNRIEDVGKPASGSIIQEGKYFCNQCKSKRLKMRKVLSGSNITLKSTMAR